MRTGTQSIDRAASLLVRVVEGDAPASVGELASAVELPKSTVSRLVSALERHGLVERKGAERAIGVGPVLLRLASRGVSRDDLVELSAGELRRLGDESRETVNLAVPSPLGVEHLAQIDSPFFLGSTNWVGKRVPYHCTAVGKAFLAFGAARLPRGRLERLTPATVVDPAELERQLVVVRARGYAVAEGDLELGLVALAAPVLDAAGRAVAALSVSGPELRLTRERVDALAPIVVEQAQALSTRLGHRHTTEGAA